MAETAASTTTTTTTSSTTTTLPPVSSGWLVSTVEASTDSGFGEDASLTADHIRGQIHISYHDSTTYGDEALRYATKGTAEVNWQISNIDSGGRKGKYSSIAFDSNGKVHISYYDTLNSNLKYATNISGTWQVATVDASGAVGLYTSLALDANDKVHISYLEDTSVIGYYNLKYATNNTGAWRTDTVETSLEGLGQTSIKVDSTGNVHIVYHKTSFKMRYAVGAFGSWTTEFFDLVSGYGFSSNQGALYLDSNDKPHVVYQFNSGLRYAKKVSGLWETETIDDKGTNMSLVLSGSGKAYISYIYYASPNYYLRYLSNVSGVWAYENVALIDGVCDSSSVDIGIGGKLHIAYHTRSLDYSLGYLRYAVQR